MKSIEVRYGCLCDDIEVQLNEQGFTLGDRAERYEGYRESITHLYFNDIITDKECDRMFQRVTKKIAKEVKPLDKQKGGAK